MATTEAVIGVVEEVRPQGLFAVRSEDGRLVLASLTPDSRKSVVRFIPGDRVFLEISPLDPSRGRIRERI